MLRGRQVPHGQVSCASGVTEEPHQQGGLWVLKIRPCLSLWACPLRIGPPSGKWATTPRAPTPGVPGPAALSSAVAHGHQVCDLTSWGPVVPAASRGCWWQYVWVGVCASFSKGWSRTDVYRQENLPRDWVCGTHGALSGRVCPWSVCSQPWASWEQSVSG